LGAEQLLKVACSQEGAYEGSEEQRKGSVAPNGFGCTFVQRAANGPRRIIHLALSLRTGRHRTTTGNSESYIKDSDVNEIRSGILPIAAEARLYQLHQTCSVFKGLKVSSLLKNTSRMKQ